MTVARRRLTLQLTPLLDLLLIVMFSQYIENREQTHAVQADLALPAPAIAVTGSDGVQLWFSLVQPVQPGQAQAIARRGQ